MILLICLTILVWSILGRPVEKLVDRLGSIDWKRYADNAWRWIRDKAGRLGIAVVRKLLLFWLVLKDDSTSVIDRALILGSIVYIVSPMDLLPRAAFHLLGMCDDAAVLAYVYNKVKGKITPEMESEADAILRQWFHTAIA